MEIIFLPHIRKYTYPRYIQKQIQFCAQSKKQMVGKNLILDSNEEVIAAEYAKKMCTRYSCRL